MSSRSRSIGRHSQHKRKHKKHRRKSRGKSREIYKDGFEKKKFTPEEKEEYLLCYHETLTQLESLENLIKQLKIRWKLLKDQKIPSPKVTAQRVKTLNDIKTKFDDFFKKCDEFKVCSTKFPTVRFREASDKCEALEKKFRKK